MDERIESCRGQIEDASKVAHDQKRADDGSSRCRVMDPPASDPIIEKERHAGETDKP